MDVDTSTFTPRLRLSRHSPVQYRASTSEAGPSRLPNVSQILDLDLKDIPLSDDQPTSGESNIPKITTTPTATRPGNPAAVLRALMSRLPAHSPSPTQSHALSVQDGTERESDFDTISESNAAPSIAQESLKDIVSKALRDPGNTPQKVRRRRNSIDASEVEASPRVGKERAKNKGKRRSMSDDEVENASQSIHHRNIRSKSTSQPITMEFLRERFSDSHNLGISIEPQRSPATSSNHDSSNDTATLLRDLNSSQATPPAATSTPQQSLRLSTTSRFQFHSNLLDQDSEMQKAIEGLDSFDEGVTHGQDSASRALNSSKILQTSPVLRHHSSTITPKTTSPSSQRLTRDQSHSMDDLRTPSQHRERLRADPSRSPSPALQLNSHHNDLNVISDKSRTKPSKDRSSILHSERHLRSEIHSTSVLFPPLLPPSSFSKERHGLPATRVIPASSRKQGTNSSYVDQEEDFSLFSSNMNAETPIQNNKSRERYLSRRNSSSQLIRTPEPAAATVHDRDMESDGLRETDFSSQGETSKPRVFTPSPDISEDGPSRSGIPPGNDELLQEHGIDSTPNHTAQTDVTTPTRNKASRSLRNEFKTPSPPKGLPELPTPSSSDESDHGSPRSNATSRMSRHSPSSLKWMATPKPPGGWLDTPKPSREATGQGGLLTPVASLSKGSDLEPKTPAIPGAWLATPAVKKSILKVRFEPQVSTLTDKFLEPAKHSDPSFDVSTSESAANGLDVGEDDLQRTEQLSLKLPPVRRQKSLKSPKIRVLDAFGREQESDVSKQECVNSSPSLLRVVDDMGHEMDEGSLGEGTEAVATPSYSAPSRGELLLRIRNGLDDLVVGLDDFDEDNQASSIDHDRVQQLTTISRQARGLRESLYSQADSSRSLLSSTLTTKTSWLPVNRRAYIFLIILQVSFVWLMYRISMIRAQALLLNAYYDPFNPELHLYIFKSDASLHVLRSEGVRTMSWSSLIGNIWDGWIHFIGRMLRFWQVWDKGAVLQYDNAWTPT